MRPLSGAGNAAFCACDVERDRAGDRRDRGSRQQCNSELLHGSPSSSDDRVTGDPVNAPHRRTRRSGIVLRSRSVCSSSLVGATRTQTVPRRLTGCGATWRQPNREGSLRCRPTPINPATILVLANETAEADELLDVIERSAGGEANVLVVAPALNSRLRHWASDEDAARDLAKERLQRSVEHLHARGRRRDGDDRRRRPAAGAARRARLVPGRPADRRHAPGRPLELARDEPRRAREPPLTRARSCT